MTQEQPITPPPELVQQWQASLDCPDNSCAQAKYIAARAARWGADMELEACCADLQTIDGWNRAVWLRSMRRPKPPSLKERALEEVGVFEGMGTCNIDIIRRALKRLQELENNDN